MQERDNRQMYEPAHLRSISVEIGRALLIGSKTNIPTKVGKVKVENFASGFEDASDNDFATVSFD